jgi:hypothetical protein
VRGWVTSLSDNTLSARLRRAGHEDSVLDGVSPPLRGLASGFSLRGQRKVTNRAATPTCSPSCVGFPRFTRLSHGTRRWALTFAIPGVGQSPLRTSLSLRQTGASLARPIPVWPLAQRRSLGVLPRGLDKRAHLGEQQGGNTQPAAPRSILDIRCMPIRDRRVIHFVHYTLRYTPFSIESFLVRQ